MHKRLAVFTLTTAACAAVVMETTMQASATVTMFCVRLVFITFNFFVYRFLNFDDGKVPVVDL